MNKVLNQAIKDDLEIKYMSNKAKRNNILKTLLCEDISKIYLLSDRTIKKDDIEIIYNSYLLGYIRGQKQEL